MARRHRLRTPGHEHEPGHEHRDLTGGGARAGIFGVSDGLVTNLSLIVGVAAASPGPGIVRLTGLAGLVAGAFSMASGEYLSMQAQTRADGARAGRRAPGAPPEPADGA